jgi:Na+-translocating ferredoxin:NAD+ oxidoreductase RnfG subunit
VINLSVKLWIEKYASYLCAPLDKCRIFPDAHDFTEIIPEKLWFALKENDTLGIVLTGSVKGYVEQIEFIVGLANDMHITGIAILHSNETPGIGEAINDTLFLNSFKEKIPDAITGATVSSQALIDGVKSKIKEYKEYLK